MYHDQLGFLSAVSEDDILIRTSTEPRTMQVAGGILFGMDESTAQAGKRWKVVTQPSAVSIRLNR